MRKSEDCMEYLLMHRNEVVVNVQLNRITGAMEKIGQKSNLDFLPLGAQKSPDDLRIWWKNRAVPETQGHIRRVLAGKGIASAPEFLLRNLGLSLTDHYWICPADREIDWNEINLFTNDFKDDIGDLQFGSALDETDEMISFANRTRFMPSASTQGELQKKWVISGGQRYLIKGNYGLSWQQSINEVLASQMHARQNAVSYADYALCDLTTVDGEKALGCSCRCFSSADVEFLSAYEVAISEKKPNDLSEYEHFIRVCEKHGLNRDEVRAFLEYQILSDFVISNTDRHFNNFGVLRDTHTLRFIGMAPIFDSGNSMFYLRNRMPSDEELREIAVTSFYKKELQLLRLVQNPNCLDFNRLLSPKEVDALMQKDIAYPLRGEWIAQAYEKKLHMLEQFQAHGLSIGKKS